MSIWVHFLSYEASSSYSLRLSYIPLSSTPLWGAISYGFTVWASKHLEMWRSEPWFAGWDGNWRFNQVPSDLLWGLERVPWVLLVAGSFQNVSLKTDNHICNHGWWWYMTVFYFFSHMKKIFLCGRLTLHNISLLHNCCQTNPNIRHRRVSRRQKASSHFNCACNWLERCIPLRSAYTVHTGFWKWYLPNLQNPFAQRQKWDEQRSFANYSQFLALYNTYVPTSEK